MADRDTNLLKRIRQNHALEHATIHLLSRRHPCPRIVARSDWGGITIYGSVDTAAVDEMATEALRRLQSGESHLAVHPRCGTNLVVGGLFAGTASSLTLIGRDRSPLRRFLAFATAALAGLALAYPLGPLFQKHLTTSSDLSGVTIRAISRERRGSLITHRIRTAQE